MDLTALYPMADALFIAPYRWFASPQLGLWAGTSILALWCIVAGEIALSLIYLTNRAYYTSLNTKMVRMHNLSIQAILCKDKESYKATNTWANEYFGKMFFSQAALFAVSIWPLPFALGWMQGRFEGIELYTIPYFGKPLGYTFVMLTCYISLRFAFSKVRRFIPILGKLESMRADDAKEAGKLQSWADLGTTKEDATAQTSDRSATGQTVLQNPVSQPAEGTV